MAVDAVQNAFIGGEIERNERENRGKRRRIELGMHAEFVSSDRKYRAEALFLLDGAEPGDLAAYARCLVLFDGADEAQLGEARGLWSRLKGEGLAVSYWRQQGRGWTKQA